MNDKLHEFKKYISSRKVAVLGLGISNTPLVRYLAGLGADITVFDKADENALKDNISLLNRYGIKYRLGKDYLSFLEGFDVVFKTPKVRYDIKELIAEKKRGAFITSEIETFMRLCPAKIYGITGSDGKTTTTTIIYELLKSQGYKCWLGGNIGIPLLGKIDDIKADDLVVLELSSFQLHNMSISPTVSIITNLSPNHLDVHTSMQEYTDAKKNIFRHQKAGDLAVLNYDNSITRDISSEVLSELRFFSTTSHLENGVCLYGDDIVFNNGKRSEQLLNRKDILLPGVHNLENYLAAIAAVAGTVEKRNILKVAHEFSGVEHRLESVRSLNGVRFYNDSIATSPNRTIAGLNSFEGKVILIAGGKDKNLDFKPLGNVILQKVKALVLIGETAAQIEASLMDAIDARRRDEKTAGEMPALIPILKCASYEEAVQKAYSCSAPGDVVILSPASTSFDMFKNFEERGNLFKKIVLSLTE